MVKTAANQQVATNETVADFMSSLVVHTKYANYLPDEKRRQNWKECVIKLKEMHQRRYPHLHQDIERALMDYVLPKKAMPSMRGIQFGGLPVELMPNRMYNCSYSPVDHPAVFSESMFGLLCGTGVGYSVCSRDTSKLPPVSAPQSHQRHLIGDSIIGWADSIKELVYSYLVGDRPMPIFDYRDIRPEGAPIVKTGGIAPGPKKLISTHTSIKKVLDGAIGRQLSTLEVHDIMCYIADCVLSGGIREAAMISLFDKSDKPMATCKSLLPVADYRIKESDESATIVCIKPDGWQAYGTDEDGYVEVTLSHKYGRYDLDQLIENWVLPWYAVHPQRARANNSAKLNRNTTTREEFFELWDTVEKSGFGEPGFFWVYDDEIGTNPCVETALYPNQFCNLTTANVFDVEGQDDLNGRVWAAAFIGTLQAGYTDFCYLRPKWAEQTEKEALLGVSMTGIASGAVLGLDLTEAATVAKMTNRQVAKAIGINEAARITCIKPEGTGTLVAGAMGSGIHAIHGKYYIRNNRIKKSHPIYSYLLSLMPDFIEDDAMDPDNRAVVSMPMAAPDGCITREESTMDMLARIKRFSSEWVKAGHNCEAPDGHNISATVSIKDGEWGQVGEWLWENRSHYNGLSVLPYFGGNYKQAPFIEISEEEYNDMLSRFPTDFNFDDVVEWQSSVNHANDNVACAGGACEI